MATSKSSIPAKTAVPKTATKNMAGALYGGGAVNKTAVNSVKSAQQGAGDNV